MHIIVNSDSDSDYDETISARRQLLADLSYEANVSVDSKSIDRVGSMLDDLVLSSSQIQQRLAAHRADLEHVEQLREHTSQQSLQACSKIDELQQSRERRREQRLREIELAQERAAEIAREKAEIAAEQERQKREAERLERLRQEEILQREQQKLAEEAARLAAEETLVAQKKQAREAALKAAEEARNEAAKEAARKEEQRKEDIRKEEQRQQEQREQEAREVELKRQELETAKSIKPGFTDPTKVAAEFTYYKDLIAKYKQDIVGQVSKQPALKSLCFGYKTKIKTKLGQLTYTKTKVAQTRNELKDLIAESRTHGELVYSWVLNTFAKVCVSHAESQAHLAVQTAIPLAMITILLWTDFAELGEFVIARLVKKCPQIIGYGCSIDTEEGRLRMGYKREDARWESQESYSERIAAMAALFGAMTQTKLGQKTGAKHPYPIQHSWVFLARQLNKAPELLLNADYAAVAAWWDICCERFQIAYGKQGTKALALAASEWTAQSGDKRYPAAARLHLLGEDWKTTGKLQQAWKPLG